MENKIRKILEQFDPENDNHWTSDGSPRLDVIKTILKTEVTRDQVTRAAPGFTRANPNLAAQGATSEQGSGDSVLQQASEPQAGILQVQKVDSEDLATLKASHAKAVEELAEISRVKAEVEKEHSLRTKRVDDLIVLLDSYGEKEKESDAIQQYLQSQRGELEKRAARMKVLQDSGIDFKELLGGLRAPVDEIRLQARKGK